MSQLALFKPSEPLYSNICPVKQPERYYNHRRDLAISKGVVLYDILFSTLEKDWTKLHDCFEKNGYILYLDMELFGERFLIKEEDSEIYLNDMVFFTWSENDVYDAKTMKKIKSALRRTLIQNQHQLLSNL